MTMANRMTDESTLTDAAKAALLDSGLVPRLKNMMHANAAAKDGDTDTLKMKAMAMADDLQQLLDSGKLDAADTQKLSSVLTRLRGALQGGSISRAGLATALSEASAAVGAVNGSKILTPQQQTDQLWLEIEKHNKTIDDNFEKMRDMGISFDDELWVKHKKLLDYMQAHPQDIEKQKELNAADDLMLHQAEPQLAKYPNAKRPFDQAKKESDERREIVDHDLAAIEKNIESTDLDWDTPIQEKPVNDTVMQDVTMNDVEPQNIGQKPSDKKSLQTFVYKHTKVYLRTKFTPTLAFPLSMAIIKAFIHKALSGGIFLTPSKLAVKSVQI